MINIIIKWYIFHDDFTLWNQKLCVCVCVCMCVCPCVCPCVCVLQVTVQLSSLLRISDAELILKYLLMFGASQKPLFSLFVD